MAGCLGQEEGKSVPARQQPTPNRQLYQVGNLGFSVLSRFR